jgi:DNA-binding LytR/AlgR family response regulator
VVFITAYPERLLTGRRPEPTFLITKPFRTETVQAIISQALFFDRKAKRRSSAMSA